MPTHVQVAGVVEEHDARGTRRINGFAENRAHQHVRTARFVDGRGPHPIELATQYLATLTHRPAPELRTTADNDARRLPAGVRVDDLKLQGSCHTIVVGPVESSRPAALRTRRASKSRPALDNSQLRPRLDRLADDREDLFPLAADERQAR